MPTDRSGPAGLALALAFIAGGGVAIQSRMNGEMSAALGEPVQAAVYSFGSGLVLLALTVLVSGRVRAGLRRIVAGVRHGRLRWWQCLGGVLGGCFVAVQTMAVPLVGVAVFIVASIAGQTTSGLVVDRLGIGPGGSRPVGASRIAAAMLAVVGVAITVADSLGEGEASPLPIVLAVAVGAGVAVQQGVNGRVNLASRSVLATTTQNFFVGTVLLLVVMALQGLQGAYTPVPFDEVPWWAWWGGLAGILFIAIAAWAVKHLGVLVFGLAMLSGQLSFALMIDLLFPARGEQVTMLMVIGSLVTFVAAVLAGWFARVRRDPPTPHLRVEG